MKLVDILARELKVWPESWGIFCVATKVDGNDAAWFNFRNPVFKDGGWEDLGSVEIWLSQEPEDRNEVVVRRFEWQAAVDALKAPKVVEWNGVGLPPIGMASCEYLGAHKYDEWTVVNIFAHYGHTVFVDFGDGWRAEDDSSRFRPIRTAEQVAAEERSKVIRKMVEEIAEEPRARHFAFCEALYDAGYRKEPKPCGS